MRNKYNKIVGAVGLGLFAVGIFTASTYLLRNSDKVFAASTIVVNSTADDQNNDGECTLREAILAANTDTASGAASGECIAGSGTDTINFAIVGAGVHTITPLTALPPIESVVSIDGYSQNQTGSVAVENTAVAPAALNGTLMIEIDGTNVTDYALLFAGNAGGSAGSSVRGLVINRFQSAQTILIGANNITVAGNYIGTDPTGLIDQGNVGSGITNESISTQHFDAQIGGLNPEDRNLISGNNDSAAYPKSGWIFQGNYIGVDATGLIGMGNSSVGASGGLSIDDCADVVVGGSQTGATNVISGNLSHGIAPDITDNLVIKGNYIGVGANGTTSIPNGGVGIAMSNSTNAVIGGSGSGEGNIINNSGLDGVYLGSDNDGISVLGNTIESNTVDGISVAYGTNITIGGSAVGAGNSVIDSGQDGITVFNTASFVTIQGNVVNTSTASGINIGDSSDVTVGGIVANSGNSINDNGVGGVIVQNNATNTDIFGNTIDSNTDNGILVSDSTNVSVGNALVGSGNIVTNSVANGISIDTAASAEVRGNEVETNGVHGIDILDSPSTIVAGNTVVGNPQDGIKIVTSVSSTVSGNNVTGQTQNGIVVTASGLTELSDNISSSNTQDGVNISGSSNVSIIGGTSSTNTQDGIQIATSDGVVIAGVTAEGNSAIGMNIDGVASTDISDSTVNDNGTYGIDFNGTTDAVSQGNIVMENALDGINIFNASGTLVGGTSALDRNIVSGNDGTANIAIVGFGGSSSNNTIQGNYIGTSSDGSINAGLIQNAGIILSANSSSNTIGGVASGAGNRIAGNNGAGILINEVTIPGPFTVSPMNNTILGNTVYGTSSGAINSFTYPGIGIDIAGVELDGGFAIVDALNEGPNANDATDVDSGANGYMNYPVLNSAKQTDSQLKLNLDLDAADSTLNDQYRVEIFANDSADSSGYGEGQTYLGAATISSGNGQDATITLPSGTNLTGKVLSATTTALSNTGTGFGSTSEFSQVLGTVSVYITPAAGGSLGRTGDILTSWYGIFSLVASGVGIVFYYNHYRRTKIYKI